DGGGGQHHAEQHPERREGEGLFVHVRSNGRQRDGVSRKSRSTPPPMSNVLLEHAPAQDARCVYGAQALSRHQDSFGQSHSMRATKRTAPAHPSRVTRDELRYRICAPATATIASVHE